MERIIWIIENNKKDLIDMQRKINSFGGMRTTCIVSDAVLRKNIEERLNQNDNLSNFSPHQIQTTRNHFFGTVQRPTILPLPMAIPYHNYRTVLD